MTDEQKPNQEQPEAGSECSAGLGDATKKVWDIQFSENGREYDGYLVVKAASLVKTGECTFIADGVEIEIDEEIREITERA